MTTEKPYRIKLHPDTRKYLCSGLYMPSVTTVLSATETEKSKASLRTWQQNNPGALEEASTRGSAIHLGCENYLRGLDPGVPDEYSDFWNAGLLSTLIGLTYSTGVDDHYVRIGITYVPDDREVAYVWNTEHMYAGCPDLIGEIGGVKVIADFKTSNAPYSAVFPDKEIVWVFSGWRKYNKCAQQWRLTASH